MAFWIGALAGALLCLVQELFGEAGVEMLVRFAVLSACFTVIGSSGRKAQ